MGTKTSPEALLGLIRSAETSKGYDDFYRGSKVKPPKPVSEMTLREVTEWQKRSISAGSKSSAVGGYQVISGTLHGVIKELGLTGNEKFDTALQDRIGLHLLARRGYNDWVDGKITDTQFGNNLSKEWAGLPVVSGTKKGRSYYAGDGLNNSTVSTGDVLSALVASRNGAPYVPSKGAGGFSAGGGGATSPSASTYTATLADFKPLDGADDGRVDRISDTRSSVFTSFNDEKRAENNPAPVDPANAPVGFWQGAGLAISDEWISSNIARQIGQPDAVPDSNWRLSEELWKEGTDGLDPAYHDELGNAVSEPHFRALAEQLRHEQGVDRQLGSLGWTGVGLRLGAAILDPLAITATALTEGAAAPLIYGAKVSRVSRMLRAGVAAGAVNAGIDGYIASQSSTMGWEDVAISAAAGFVLGSAIGGLRRRTPDDVEIAAAIQRAEGAGIQRVLSGQPADGSLSAARVPQPETLSAAEQVALDSVDAPRTALAAARIDRSAIGKTSESDIMRRVQGGLVEDGVGNADGSTNRFSVSEAVSRDERVRTARFYRVYNEEYADWLKSKNLPFWKHGVEERARFNTMVSKAVRREIDAAADPHVNAVAAKMKEEFADLLKFGKEHGVRGFDEIGENYNYMVRRHRIERIDELMSEFGEGNIVRLVAQSLQSANRKWRNANPSRAAAVDEIDYEDALAISDSYLKSIRSRRYGEFSLNRALAGQDLDTLKMMLDDSGMASADVTRILDKVRFTADSGETGRIGSAKWRLNIDETYTEKLINKSGVSRQVGIEDMLENDAEVLFGGYARSVLAAGHTENFLKEFRVRDAEGNLPVHAPSFETVKGYIKDEAGRKGMTSMQVAKEMRVLDNSYKLIHGVPVEPHSSSRVFLRRLRDFNFSRIGGQLGVAQLAEVGSILGNGGLRNLVNNVPALKGIYTTARTGKFKDDFLNEIEAIWGFGTDLTRMNMTPMFDEIGAAEMRQASSGQRVDHLLQRAKRVTVVGSGMGHINMALQRMNARVLVQRFMDDATGVRGINERRLRAMGVSEDMHPRIKAQLARHVDQTDGMIGKRVSRINIEKWDDVDAKNAFINGVDRWARKSVQENDIGNMPDFMSYELGKTIFQFRSFMIAAYVKQTLAGIHHRDWETFAAFSTSMLFGGLFYAGQQYINSIGRADREDFLEKRLNPTSLAEAGFQRAAFSSVLPIGYDTIREAIGLEPVFDFRSSALRGGGGPVGAALGNPTGDLIDALFRATGGVASAALTDRDFSDRDVKAIAKLLLFQNMFGIQNVTAAVAGQLPKAQD